MRVPLPFCNAENFGHGLSSTGVKRTQFEHCNSVAGDPKQTWIQYDIGAIEGPGPMAERLRPEPLS